MNTKIIDVNFYLPETVISNDDLKLEFPELDVGRVFQKLGIQSRHVCTGNETALTLGEKAAFRVLESSHCSKDDIDFLIFCTQSPDYYLPPNSCLLHSRLNLPKSTGTLDISHGCSGFIYGLGMANSLIASGMAQRVLLVTAETYSRHINQRDRANRCIFGDGAAATLLEKDGGTGTPRLGKFVFGTDGEGADKLLVPRGGMAARYDRESPLVEYAPGCFHTENDLYMSGSDVFNFTIEAVPALVQKILSENNLVLDNVDYVVFHQANAYMLEYLRRKINIPVEKFHVDMADVGNTVSASIPIALCGAVAQQKIRPGDKILLVGFGVGFSYGGTVITW